MAKSKPMTKAAAERIQSATAVKNGEVRKGDFVSRAQRAAEKNTVKGGKHNG